MLLLHFYFLRIFVACAVAYCLHVFTNILYPLVPWDRTHDHLALHESQSRRHKSTKHCLQGTGRQVWLTDWQSQEMLRSNMSKIVKCSASVRRGFMSSASLTHPVPVHPWGESRKILTRSLHLPARLQRWHCLPSRIPLLSLLTSDLELLGSAQRPQSSFRGRMTL